MFKSLLIPILLLTLNVGCNGSPVGEQVESVGDRKKKSKPKFTVSKETTHITQPLTEDGYPDYAAAINQLLGKGVTPMNNANVLFWRAHGPHPEQATMPAKFFDLMGIESPPEDGEYFLALGQYLFKIEGFKLLDERLVEIYDHQSQASSRPWKAAQYPEVAKWLTTNEKPLALVREGSLRNKYFSPLVVTNDEEENSGLIGVLLPAVQSSRSFARALSARAMLRLGEGNVTGAWDDLLTCHRLARLIARGPTLIEGLVGVTIDGIATHADLAFIQHSKPNAQQVAAYLRDLDELAPLINVTEKIDVSERFMFLDSTFLIASGGAFKTLAALAGGEATGVEEIVDEKVFAAIDWDVVMRIGNHWYDRLVAAMKTKDRREMVMALKKIDADLEALGKEAKDVQKLLKRLTGKEKKPKEVVSQMIGDMMVALLLPALHAVKSAESRAEQQQQNLRIAFALAAFRSDNKRYPKRLSELSPKYLKSLPSDLFTGKALVYKPSANGYLFYSFGRNEKDDKGRLQDDDPSGDDLRVRMPLPELKRD